MRFTRMRNLHPDSRILKFAICLLMVISMISCKTTEWAVPQGYTGHWETGKVKITVRYKLNKDDRHSQFISDSAITKIEINDDKTVSGSIGRSVIDNGKIVKSWSFPGLRNVEYHIECSLTGKIFEKDPLETKKVDIWLTLLNEKGKIKADLRPIGSNFPMALMLLEKVNK